MVEKAEDIPISALSLKLHFYICKNKDIQNTNFFPIIEMLS